MKKLAMMVVVAVFCALSAGPAQAQRFGGQLSWGSDSDLGVGARAEFDMKNVLSKTQPFSDAFIITQFDYYFMDCAFNVDCTYWELNPSLAVPIKAQSLKPYLGAGLHIAHLSVANGGSDTGTGINLLGGLKFGLGTLDAFSEARVSLGDYDQLALSFGFLFGGKKK